MGKASGEDAMGPGNGRPVQRRAARANGWTKARRAAFLAELAASCNVVRAHEAAGMASSGVYRLRQRDPEFAAQWQAALEIGYERLETALVRRALEAVDNLELDEAREPVAKMTVAEATALLRLHRASVARGQARGRRAPAHQVPTQQEVDAILIRRIRMVKRQRAVRAAGDPPTLKDTA
ncbi:hypothetical protein [Sphingopyxis terrae]|uniref:hypothetical protein n=1 Tax=Sphingopyxis terrae TaxID=33052 RepID=UPI0007873E30|nr:hypothetical protein [Sphingopyxis terrae]